MGLNNKSELSYVEHKDCTTLFKKINHKRMNKTVVENENKGKFRFNFEEQDS